MCLAPLNPPPPRTPVYRPDMPQSSRTLIKITAMCGSGGAFGDTKQQRPEDNAERCYCNHQGAEDQKFMSEMRKVFCICILNKEKFFKLCRDR